MADAWRQDRGEGRVLARAVVPVNFLSLGLIYGNTTLPKGRALVQCSVLAFLPYVASRASGQFCDKAALG